jgi:hypothetical protein
MDRDEVVAILVEILTEMQADCEGDPANLVINENTKPLDDLVNFDSLTGVQATCLCLERIPLRNSEKIITLFESHSSKDGRFALTVGSVADRILSLQNDQGGI